MSSVLLVDDNEGLRETFSDALREAGLEVCEAADGAAALGVLETRSVDVIVTDLLMPNMDGIELILALRERSLAQPVLVMTGGLSDLLGSGDDRIGSSLAAARVLGAVRTLRKPLLPSELIHEVRAQLGP